MSSNRNSAIAGALAGLLVAGFGAWYVNQPRAQALPAVATPVAAVPVAHAAAAISREQAVAKLMALPELKRWSDSIEQRSGGTRHGALLETDPAPREVNGKPYYQLSFVENGDDMAQSLASFLVSHAGGEILVEDDASGDLLPLEQWRKKQN